MDNAAAVTAEPGGIHAAIAAIMGEVGGVGKGRQNKQQGYSFRGIADVTLACQPLMAKHGVHVVPHHVTSDTLYERKTRNDGFSAHVRQRIVFRFYHSDGSFVECETTGEAMDTGDKASNKAMAVALKYALTVTFCIPEEDPTIDTENESPDIVPAAPKAAAPRPKPPGDDKSAGSAAALTEAKVPGVWPADVPEGQAPVFLFRNGKWEDSGGRGELISASHHKRVKILQKEAKVPDDVWHEKLTIYYGKNSSLMLTDEEGLDVIERLEAAKRLVADG